MNASSASASAPPSLERGYRRLVACYPRSFRKENAEEIVAVLLATSAPGQRRPGLTESLDLLKGAARMHMGLSRAPRTVVTAVRLMYLGAVAQVGVLITTLVTASSIRASAVHHYPQYAAQVTKLINFDIKVDMVTLPIAILLWLWVAWGNGRGSQWGRLAAIILAFVYTMAMAMELAQGTATVAPAAMIVSAIAWALGVVAVVFIFQRQSWPYYERRQPSHLQEVGL